MSVHEDWLAVAKSWKETLKAKTGKDFQFPPPCIETLKLEYLDVQPGKKMLAKLPYQRQFTNPVGLYQGGFLAAGIDEVFGPLGYITAGTPCMTLSMNISYLRPFSADLGHVLIEGMVLQKTKSFIFMRAEVKSPNGELLAHAETHMSIMRDDQLTKGL